MTKYRVMHHYNSWNDFVTSFVDEMEFNTEEDAKQYMVNFEEKNPNRCYQRYYEISDEEVEAERLRNFEYRKKRRIY